MNKANREHAAVVYGGGLVCDLGPNLREVSRACQQLKHPQPIPQIPLDRPSLLDSLHAALGDAIPQLPTMPLSNCSVFLLVPEEPRFGPEAFAAEVERIANARLGITTRPATCIRGEEVGLRALIAAIHAMRAPHTEPDTAVLVVAIQDVRVHQDIAPAVAALMLTKIPKANAYTELVGASTGSPTPLQTAIEGTLTMANTSIRDVGHLVVDDYSWAPTSKAVRHVLDSASRASRSPTMVWSGPDALEDLGVASGLATLLLAYDIAQRGWPNMQCMWVAGEGAHVALLRRRGPVVP